jgi:hypothetical protein
MLTKPTVIVLGAGASVPYGFYSGLELLNEARRLATEQFVGFIPPEHQGEARALHAALKGTLARSIDAMLEKRLDLVDAGKCFMARWLLQCERNMLARNVAEDGRRAQQWHEILWDACDQRSLKDFRETPLTLVTYNYDRSVEFALVRSLQHTFPDEDSQWRYGLDGIGPIHLHGQLGILPQLMSSPKDALIQYGAGGHNVDGDVLTAAQGIRIVHEPEPVDEPFVRARDAISKADRVIFLGFAYAQQNVERLQLRECMRPDTDIYLCTTGYTPAQVAAYVRPHFTEWHGRVRVGAEQQDIVQFFRTFPEALL